LSTVADVLRVSNEASVDRKRASAENWNSYFAALRTGRQEKPGTEFTTASSAGAIRGGAPSAAARALSSPSWAAKADAPATTQATASERSASRSQPRAFTRRERW
jgi:hypothetical protein